MNKTNKKFKYTITIDRVELENQGEWDFTYYPEEIEIETDTELSEEDILEHIKDLTLEINSDTQEPYEGGYTMEECTIYSYKEISKDIFKDAKKELINLAILSNNTSEHETAFVKVNTALQIGELYSQIVKSINTTIDEETLNELLENNIKDFTVELKLTNEFFDLFKKIARLESTLLVS